MDIVFISGVELGRFALQGILDSSSYIDGDIRIKGIFSLADSKASRTSGYTKFDDLAKNTDLHYVQSIKSMDVISKITNYSPDFIFIIGWSELAPEILLDIPKNKYKSINRHDKTHGCIGMHPTLLPQGRGRAPIPWAIIKGLKQSGVTLFYLENQADSGDIILQKEFAIDLDDDASTVYQKVAQIHYTLTKTAMPLLVNGDAPRIIQDTSQVTHWAKRTPEDGIINWNKSQLEQHNWIRALTHPYPGAFTYWKNHRVTLWKSKVVSFFGSYNDYEPGSVVSINKDGIFIACVDTPILVTALQFEEDEILDGLAFSEKYNLQIGDLFK